MEQDHYRGPSFSTIAGSGSNGAVIHYRPSEETNAAVNDSAVLLVDSGGLYADGGTTDITRTFFFGPEPPAEVVDSYTRFFTHSEGGKTSLKTHPNNFERAGS